jgi:SAM-dependent methyltransferase
VNEIADLRRRVSQANIACYDAEGAREYIDGAPHLKHAKLRDLYAELIVELFEAAKKHTSTPRVLDLGAGEGSVTLPMLELGATVTAVDLSREMLTTLEQKCAAHGDRLTVRCEDIEETLRNDDTQYDVVTANSFLHHVPDYLSMLRAVIPHISANGHFFAFQDPLHHATLVSGTRIFDQLAYATWRIGKADAWGGIWRYLRRARGEFREDSPHDNAEYHVLRDGVDQLAIESVFKEEGFDCRIIPYFSTQSRIFQPIGTALGLKNTFAFVARRRSS